MKDDGSLRLVAGAVSARFDARTGLLIELARDGRVQPLSNGPRLVVARPKGGAELTWLEPTAKAEGVYEFAQPTMANVASVDLGLVETDGWAGFRLELSADGEHWKTVYDGARVARDGQTYIFPPQRVKVVRISQLTGVRKTPGVARLKLAYEAERFALPAVDTPVVRSGVSTGRPGTLGARL